MPWVRRSIQTKGLNDAKDAAVKRNQIQLIPTQNVFVPAYKHEAYNCKFKITLQNLFSSKYLFSSDLFATAKQHIAKIIQKHALHKTNLRWAGDKLKRIYLDSLVLRR